MKNYLKKNKPLLLLPLALVPFVVLIFYILGGGSGKQVKEQSETRNDTLKGANYTIPDADRDIRIYDKMEAAQSQNGLTQTHDYNIMGGKDSLAGSGDPLPPVPEDSPQAGTTGATQTTETSGTTEITETAGTSFATDNPAGLLDHIRRREAQLRKDLSGESSPQNNTVKQNAVAKPGREAGANSEKGNRTPVQTTGLDNQIPTGIMESNRVFTQNKKLAESNDSLSKRLTRAEDRLKKAEEEKQELFSLEKSVSRGFNDPQRTKTANSSSVPIKAEVYETATVLTGNRVKLRLLEDCRLDGMRIARNTFVYGSCAINNERLEVNVTQIPVNENFIPVQVSVYDLDGQKGLYVPDNASRKAAGEAGSGVNTSSMFGVTNNPLLYAGIQAADRATRSVAKMIRIKKVTVKKNTLVYLVNKTQ